MSVYPHYDEPHFVYFHYDAEGTLLYVGCTYNPPQRLAQHAKRSAWFGDVAHVRHVVYPTRAYGLAKEREAIETLRPRFNRLRAVA